MEHDAHRAIARVSARLIESAQSPERVKTRAVFADIAVYARLLDALTVPAGMPDVCFPERQRLALAVVGVVAAVGKRAQQTDDDARRLRSRLSGVVDTLDRLAAASEDMRECVTDEARDKALDRARAALARVALDAETTADPGDGWLPGQLALRFDDTETTAPTIDTGEPS